MFEFDYMDYPLEKALSFIRGKWKFYIICSLLERPKHFSELQRSLGNISQKALSDNLRAMEKDGLLTRIRSGAAQQELYKLTRIGYGFNAVIDELVRWGQKYGAYVMEPDKFIS
jgi:DNA-binding HxlR family transcriptional regulator